VQQACAHRVACPARLSELRRLGAACQRELCCRVHPDHRHAAENATAARQDGPDPEHRVGLALRLPDEIVVALPDVHLAAHRDGIDRAQKAHRDETDIAGLAEAVHRRGAALQAQCQRDEVLRARRLADPVPPAFADAEGLRDADRLARALRDG
jgi:hypothetical protein